MYDEIVYPVVSLECCPMLFIYLIPGLLKSLDVPTQRIKSIPCVSLLRVKMVNIHVHEPLLYDCIFSALFSQGKSGGEAAQVP